MDLLGKIYRNTYYQTVLRQLERKNAKTNNISRKSTIAVFANPRGGSTWLGEILQKGINNSALILEPLFSGVYKTDGKMPTGHKPYMHTKKLDFWYYQHICDNENWPEAQRFFKQLFNRELLPLSIVYENKLNSILKANTFIYKFCLGHLLLPWVAENFNVSSIFLVRHPGAVIASQLKHGSWKHIKNSTEYKFVLPKFRNSEYFDQYKDILEAVKKPEENLAAMWAISTLHVIKHKNNNIKWKTISYENLFLQPEKILAELFQYIGLDFSPEALRNVSTPSKTTISSSIRDLQSNKQVSKWRNYLSQQQQENIKNILNQFNVDYYSMDDDMPLL